MRKLELKLAEANPIRLLTSTFNDRLKALHQGLGEDLADYYRRGVDIPRKLSGEGNSGYHSR